MKTASFLLLAVILSSCVAPAGRSTTYRTPSKRANHSYHSGGSVNDYSMGGTSTANPPIQPGETSSAYRERLARQQREAVPDAEFMYQNTQQDILGRSTQSGIYRQRGGVTEEIHIGNQPIPNNYNGFAPTYPNVYQGGYAPPGTSAVYDPYTGRVLPVRR
jgi:hypothetical protein